VESVVDTAGKTVFRYNELFRAFLKQMFRSEFDEKEQKAIFRRAGQMCWDQMKTEASVTFFLQGGAYKQAAESIKQVGKDLSIKGRFTDLSRWILTLPKEMRESDPWMLFYLTLTRRISGGYRNIKDFQTAMQLFKETTDPRGYMLSFAYLIEAAIFLGYRHDRIRSWISEGETVLKKYSDTPYFAYAKAVLWLQIGFGLIAGAHDIKKGLSACQNAYLLAHHIGDTDLQINAMIISVLGHATAGEFTQADGALLKIAPLIGDTAYPEYRTLQNIVNMELALHKGALPEAEKYHEIIQADIETFGLLFLYPMFIHASGMMYIYQGKYEEAESTAGHLSDVAVLANNVYYKGLAKRLSGMIHYHNERFQSAERFTAQAVAILSESAQENIHLYRSKELLGIIRMHRNQYRKSRDELSGALAFFDAELNPLSVSETHLALGLLEHGKKNEKTARDHLANGFQTAAAEKYEHFIMLCPKDLMKACVLAMEMAIDTAMPHASFLLSNKLAFLVGGDLEKIAMEPMPGRALPVKVQKAIHRSKRERLNVKTLGGFQVFRNKQTPIGGREWTGRRPKLLLKSILVHGSREIPKDILVDDLWPKSGQRAASRNFKVNLHRLRKILEPDMDRSFGSSYIHLKDGLVSLDKDLCTTDIETFLGLLKKIRNQSDTGGDTKTILSLCRQAEALYQGDFLPEDPYEPWIEIKRAALKENYITLLFRMTDIFDGLGGGDPAVHTCRKILRADPFSESAVQRLMGFYQSLGLQHKAIRVYSDFKKRLKADLDLVPDEATTALYRQIRRR
jgi:DNA-binding SARP family transcriptional activator